MHISVREVYGWYIQRCPIYKSRNFSLIEHMLILQVRKTSSWIVHAILNGKFWLAHLCLLTALFSFNSRSAPKSCFSPSVMIRNKRQNVGSWHTQIMMLPKTSDQSSRSFATKHMDFKFWGCAASHEMHTRVLNWLPLLSMLHHIWS